MEGNEKVLENNFFSHDNFRNKSATAGGQKESTELELWNRKDGSRPSNGND